MEIRFNGEEKDILENMTLKEFLEQGNYSMNRIAAEVNGDIIPKAKYAELILHSGDVVEVVSFVGGG